MRDFTCLCTDEVMCPAMIEIWTKLQTMHEEKTVAKNAKEYMLLREGYISHRTRVLTEKKFLTPGSSIAFVHYPDWRERLNPDYDYRKENNS